MKLEFDTNIASLPLVESTEFDEMISDSNSPEVTKMLRDGIEAAQNGERAEARAILLRVTEADANNENAWLWLASISEYPEELLVFLKNVLSINPNNERAIEWSKATESLMAKTFVQRGIDAAKNEQKDIAKQCFLQAIVHNRESELAWLWLASVSGSPEEKMSHLQKVLRINPHNENAVASLKSAKMQMAKVLLPRANKLAIEGKREEAQKLLDEIVNDSPDFEDAWMLKAHLAESLEEKIGYFEQVYEVNPNNQVAKANLDSLRMFVDKSDSGDEISESAESADNSDDMSLESADNNSSEEPESVNENYAASTETDTDDFESESDGLELDSQELNSEDDDPQLEVDAEAVQEQEMSEVSTVELEQQDSNELMENEASEDYSQDLDAVEHYHDSTGFEENESQEEVSFDEESVEFDEVEDSDAQLEMAQEKADQEQNKQEVTMEFADEMSENSESVRNDSYLEEEAVNEYLLESTAAEPEYLEASEEEEQDESIDDFESMHFDENASEFESSESIDEEVQDLSESFEYETPGELIPCSFCESENDLQAFSCGECNTVLSLSDIEMLLLQEEADDEVIKDKLKKLEADRETVGVSVEELMTLGIGYINLKVYRKGFEYLQEAAQKDQNNVMLSSQLDALAIRINEIEEQEKVSDAQPKSKTILVVDDSPTVRKLISGKLEKSGHDAVCAVDGMDALAKINEVIPDLILLDITMPRMDGYQVCKLIRGNDATKDVPIVMISGKDGFFDKVRGKMAGTDNYITKPFGPETLMKTVNEYIS